jgi:hypothetical protein
MAAMTTPLSTAALPAASRRSTRAFGGYGFDGKATALAKMLVSTAVAWASVVFACSVARLLKVAAPMRPWKVPVPIDPTPS